MIVIVHHELSRSANLRRGLPIAEACADICIYIYIYISISISNHNSHNDDDNDDDVD